MRLLFASASKKNMGQKTRVRMLLLQTICERHFEVVTNQIAKNFTE